MGTSRYRKIFSAISILIFLIGQEPAAAVGAPVGYLHCTPEIGELASPHEVILYSDAAEVDDLSYLLRTKPDSYVLEGPIKIVADMLAPRVLFVINRISGKYVIFNGRHPESGECTRVQPKF